MLDFGFKAKPKPSAMLGRSGYAMLDFGFKAKPGNHGATLFRRYAMLDFGFKAKQRRPWFHKSLVMPCLILDSRQNLITLIDTRRLVMPCLILDSRQNDGHQTHMTKWGYAMLDFGFKAKLR